MRLPSIASNCFAVTRGRFVSFSISPRHLECLCVGKEILRDLVLMIHPKTVFCSSSRPSALNFFNDIISLRGIISDESSGLAKVRIARGIARLTRCVTFGKFGVIPMESSMYISTFPKSFLGSETASSLAGWNGMEFGRRMGDRVHLIKGRMFRWDPKTCFE